MPRLVAIVRTKALSPQDFSPGHSLIRTSPRQHHLQASPHSLLHRHPQKPASGHYCTSPCSTGIHHLSAPHFAEVSGFSERPVATRQHRLWSHCRLRHRLHWYRLCAGAVLAPKCESHHHDARCLGLCGFLQSDRDKHHRRQRRCGRDPHVVRCRLDPLRTRCSAANRHRSM